MATSSKALQRQVTAAITDRVAKIRRQDERIVAAMSLAATFDDGEDPPLEWKGRLLTKIERQVAKDARKSRREAPAYLEASSRRFELLQKIDALRPPPPVALNAHSITIVQAADSGARYPVIDISAEGIVKVEDGK